MKKEDLNKSLEGKEVTAIFTGLWVRGVVTEFIDDFESLGCSICVKVKFHQPVRWGDTLYNDNWYFIRKCDLFGIDGIKLV